ncbi:hypothetical protein [Bacillus stratosphericus]|uniref:hypothetical protein n=1 Tax=Bacillus stratosphericus TaxID=293386 RepID=UPI001CFB3F60|nr:hypothetical protein [Bacillus stratosphericus]
MKPIYQYDDKFIYVFGGDSKVAEGEEIPAGFTDVQPREGLYLPKYSEKKKTWSESATEEYIEDLQPKPQPTETEVMKQQIADLYYLIALGGM